MKIFLNIVILFLQLKKVNRYVGMSRELKKVLLLWKTNIITNHWNRNWETCNLNPTSYGREPENDHAYPAPFLFWERDVSTDLDRNSDTEVFQWVLKL